MGTQQKRSSIRINLLQLILLLAISSVIVVLVNSLFVSYRVQRDLLVSTVTQANRAYAAKLATSIDEFLETAQQQLAFGAAVIGENWNNPKAIATETRRLKHQTDSFNSVVTVNHLGTVLATDPDLGLVDSRLTSESSRTALEKRQGWISSPFVSSTGNLIIFISQPVFAPDGKYLGYVGGTIYLLANNILNDILGNHYYQDGSYVSVIDQNRKILYHRQSDLIGTEAPPRMLYQDVLKGQTGGTRLTNAENLDVMAGFAPVKHTGWGVVVQKPTDLALAPLSKATEEVLIRSLPLTTLIALGILWMSRRITLPLRKLADSARNLDQPGVGEAIRSVKSWYFEAAELKRAMILGTDMVRGTIEKLNHDVQIDALTGLFNRRRQETALTVWEAEGRPFALMEVDIDFFKRVNDTHGHPVGDQVLEQIASLITHHTRNDDLACRIGGEEFTLLLPDTTAQAAYQIAERLRKAVESALFPGVGRVTISIGVALWPEQVDNIHEVMRVADQMLYKAKHNGRNQVQMAWADQTQKIRA